MLQIVTGKFFRDVELHEMTHRSVLFTNAKVLSRAEIILPMARLKPSTAIVPVSTVAVELTERLEATRPDGRDEFLVSTGGEELLADLASVLSFACNAIFSSDMDLVRRLVKGSDAGEDRTSPSHVLRRTFDADLFVRDEEIDDIDQFVTQLVALNRASFEQAIRAIRQVVSASTRVADDPTLAYTMFVAALESLSTGVEPPEASWTTLDGRKRRIIDTALAGVELLHAERIRAAILEAEQAGATRRFVTFVLEHVSPSYYRAEATAALRPMSAFELERALKRAYAIRSKNVHLLEELPREAWVYTDRADAVNPAGMGLMLSLEGLNRLSRHVIRGFIARAPTVQEEDFDYRAALPNILRMQLAPQLWVGDSTTLSAKSAASRLNGFVELLIEALRPSSNGPAEKSQPPETKTIPVDMHPVLDRIEKILPGIRKPVARRSLIAIYLIWHRILKEEFHQPSAESFLKLYNQELEAPSLQGFIVATVLHLEPSWTVSDYEELTNQRRIDRSKGRAEPVDAAFEAALAAKTALMLAAEDRHDEAKSFLARAVEEWPGNVRLIEAESAYQKGQPLVIDVNALVFGIPLPTPVDPESTVETST